MEAQAKSVRAGATVMMVMAVYALVLSLAWIFLTEVMFVSDFAAYTGQTFAEYLSSSPRYAEIYIIAKKLIGIELLSASLLMIFVVQKGYSRAEKWSWYAMLVAGAITWGSLIGYKIVIGYFKPNASSMTFIVGAILLAIGLALPARAILGRKSE